MTLALECPCLGRRLHRRTLRVGRELRRQPVGDSALQRSRLESLSDEEFARSSIHPRTKIQMRIIDLCVFAADHDDYHLARISELKRSFA